MKKLPARVLTLAIVAALAALAAVFALNRKAPGHLAGPALAPADTALFVHLPDCRTSAKRWKETSLHRLLDEPEMRAFLAKPLEAVAQLRGFVDALATIARLDVGEAFLAVGPVDSKSPPLLAGFQTPLGRDAAEREMEPARRALIERYPAGASDLVSHRDIPVEVFQDRSFTLATTTHRGWFLLSTDPPTLHAALDRLDGIVRSDTLARDATFAHALSHLPQRHEVSLFVRAREPMERLLALMEVQAQGSDPEARAELAKIESIAASMSFEGTRIRDVIYLHAPGARQLAPPLTHRTLALASAGTILALTFPIDPPPSRDTAPAPPAGDPLAQLLAWIGGLKTAGVTPEILQKAFAPELGIQVDWPAGGARPSLLASIPVNDPQLADRTLQDVDRSPLSPAPGRDGMILLSPPIPNPLDGRPLAGAKIVAARAGDHLVLGLDEGAVGAARARAAKPAADDGDTPAARAALDDVAPADLGFVYVDIANLLRRILEVARLPLVFAVALIPESARYVDMGKLPATETLARHLLPVTFAARRQPEGVLMESRGTITLGQLAAALGTGSASAIIARKRMAEKSQSLEGATGRPPGSTRSP